MRAKTIAALCAHALLALAGGSAAPAAAENAPAICQAIDSGRQVAAAQFRLLDEGRFDEAWEGASEAFRKQVKKEDWLRIAHAARVPLGSVSGRKLRTLTYSTTLQGMPDGEYVVAVFESGFANKANTSESVVAAREADGGWRLAGYFIK